MGHGANHATMIGCIPYKEGIVQVFLHIGRSDTSTFLDQLLDLIKDGGPDLVWLLKKELEREFFHCLVGNGVTADLISRIEDKWLLCANLLHYIGLLSYQKLDPITSLKQGDN